MDGLSEPREPVAEVASNAQRRGDDATQLLHELLAINGNIKHNFEGEVSGYQAKIQAQRRAMNMLQAERNQYVAEAQKTQACYLEALEESKASSLATHMKREGPLLLCCRR